MEVNKLERLVDYYRENKISHAYLLETNDIETCFNDLKEVIKKIFCQNEYKSKCTMCNICNLIDQQFLPSLMIIEPNGSIIKKEQVLELKRNFSSVPVYTKENIYVIKYAEKLNDSSANTMLKFIEEPEEHIIGFFITNNANAVIPTIKSRCEIINVRYDIESAASCEEKYYNVVNEYLKKIEVEKKEMIMYNKNVILNSFTEREDIKNIFNYILKIYKSKFQLLLGNTDEYRSFDFLNNLTRDELLKRIKLVTEFLDNINYNANIELLLDKFIIELSD